MTEQNYKTKATPKAMADGVPVFCSHDAIEDVVKLVPNPKNPNKHPEDQIELLARIIQATGWRQPITVSKRSGYVVKGHGRMLAAVEAGLKAVPVDYQDYATEAEEYADLVADNRLAELSEIDNKMLADVFKDINLDDIPAELTGYDEEAFKDIIDVFSDVDPSSFDPSEHAPDVSSSANTGDDFKSVEETSLHHKCPRCGFEFD